MTPEKLEALRKLAADERTPIEEARNAATKQLEDLRTHGKALLAFVQMLPEQVHVLVGGRASRRVRAQASSAQRMPRSSRGLRRMRKP